MIPIFDDEGRTIRIAASPKQVYAHAEQLKHLHHPPVAGCAWARTSLMVGKMVGRNKKRAAKARIS
jgi:hypothetical protein